MNDLIYERTMRSPLGELYKKKFRAKYIKHTENSIYIKLVGGKKMWVRKNNVFNF